MAMNLPRLVRMAAVTVIAAGACAGSGSKATPHASPHRCVAESGSPTDVAGEPDWRRYAPYRPWTDRSGCLVRIDVLAERPGPEHCGSQGATVLIAGRPLGTRYGTAADTIEYVRDPDQAFGRAQLAQGFEPDARLP